MREWILPIVLLLVVGTLGCGGSGKDESTPEIANQPVALEEATGELTVADIEQLGGRAVVDKRSPDRPILEIRLPSDHVTDAVLARMRGLTSLKVLVLNAAPSVDSKGPEGSDVEPFTAGMDGPLVSNTGLEHLRGLTRLETLDLGGAAFVTDAGLEHLKGLSNLRVLNLSWISITDAGLEHLSSLNRLERLGLAMTVITDAGLEHLQGLTNLKSLKLTGTKITDAGLEHLQGLKYLDRLVIGMTAVSDAGLKHLTGLTNLRTLDVTYTRIVENDDGVKTLKEALPECEIRLRANR